MDCVPVIFLRFSNGSRTSFGDIACFSYVNIILHVNMHNVCAKTCVVSDLLCLS